MTTRGFSSSLLVISIFLLAISGTTYAKNIEKRTSPELTNYVLSAMNFSIDPCQDFYNFSCGMWIAKTPLPPSKSSYPRNIGQIQQNNNNILISICEDPANGKVFLLFFNYYY